MDCISFRRHLGQMTAQAVFDARQGDGHTRYFSAGRPSFDQDSDERSAEQCFIVHFECCFACRQRYQELRLNTIPEFGGEHGVSDAIAVIFEITRRRSRKSRRHRDL